MTDWFEWREAPAVEFAVLGDPVAHSLSPQMHAAAFTVLNQPFRYVAIRSSREELHQALDRLTALGYRGLNVTVPLKEEAYRWCLSTDELTERIKAVNTISPQDRRGTNTDAPGILDVLMELGVPIGATILLIGAGGTARAVAAALHRGGFPLSVYNRTRDRAEAMISDLGIVASILAAPNPEGTSVVINATSASLQGSAVPIDWELSTGGGIALDLVYSDGPTPFMVEAQAAGWTTFDGRTLLVAQGARSLEWWLGIEAPRSAMLKAIS